jgi:hypothetical protein
MAINPEGGDILREVTDIIDQAKRDAKPVNVLLSVEAVIVIATTAVSFRELDNEDDRRMAHSLDGKFISALGITTQRPVPTNQPICIGLSGNEIDFINNGLLHHISLAGSIGNKFNSEYSKNVTLSATRQAMATLIDLNSTFTKAGGTPRPNFIRFYQGG